MTQCWPYKEGETWFFRVIYEITDKDSGEIVLANFPKIRNPFNINNDLIAEIDSNCIGSLSCTLHTQYCDLPVEYGIDENIGDKDSDYFYSKTIIKEGKKPPKEMTVAQIEKELGYSVKIVKEKGKK